MLPSLEDLLGTEELRARLLKYSRQAYRLLPAAHKPRILDIGCGTGLPTIELARWSHGEVTGIDTDGAALARLRRRIEGAGLNERITAVNASIYDTGLPAEAFDIIWDEGALHVLDPTRSFPECLRLLKPDGFLAMCETVRWLESVSGRLGSFGFSLFDRHPLPAGCWWTEYYAPLDSRIRALREKHGEAIDLVELARYENEIRMVRDDPGRFDCTFYLVRRTGIRPPVSS